ncbi:STAS domain-containing protein [Streptomyces populi]
MAADTRASAEQPGRLAITQTISAGVRVLTLVGELDADNVHLLQGALSADGDFPCTVLDFGAVAFMDSSAIAVLALARQHAAEAGGWVRMAALTPPVQRVVNFVGLNMIADCYPQLADA